jgi:hypothetical protein
MYCPPPGLSTENGDILVFPQANAAAGLQRALVWSLGPAARLALPECRMSPFP